MMTVSGRYIPQMNRLLVGFLAAVLAVSVAAPVAAAPDHATGLERAREMSMKALDHVRGKSADAPGQNKADKVTGRQRALQAIAQGLARGNSATVLQMVIDGPSPSAIAGDHGAAVRKMVEAFNALKKG